jgi:hypothetical protein
MLVLQEHSCAGTSYRNAGLATALKRSFGRPLADIGRSADRDRPSGEDFGTCPPRVDDKWPLLATLDVIRKASVSAANNCGPSDLIAVKSPPAGSRELQSKADQKIGCCDQRGTNQSAALSAIDGK